MAIGVDAVKSGKNTHFLDNVCEAMVENPSAGLDESDSIQKSKSLYTTNEGVIDCCGIHLMLHTSSY